MTVVDKKSDFNKEVFFQFVDKSIASYSPYSFEGSYIEGKFPDLTSVKEDEKKDTRDQIEEEEEITLRIYRINF